MPENPGPSWKHQGSSPPDKPAAPATPAWKKDAGAAGANGPRPWQDQGTTPAAPPGPRSRGVKLVAAVVALGAVLGAVVLVLTLLRQVKPACLVLLGTSYDTKLAIPHNVYGWKGLQDFRDVAEAPGFVSSLFAGPSKARLAFAAQEEVKDRKSWDKLWAAAPKDIAEETVLLFLSFHGGADAKGPFFFLNDPRGQQRLYLHEVFKELETRWPAKNVVLFLEPAQVEAHWTAGMLKNDFVKKLKEMDKELQAHPRLLVFCASDEDQVSWASEEWRRTIFTHYVIEALAGAADSDGSHRVSASELFDYVRKNVSAWARANRGAAQTPTVLGAKDKASGIELVYVPEPYVTRSADEAPGKKFIPSRDLENAWSACALLGKQAPSPAAYTPHLWRVYRDTLLRWEQLERAGDPTGKVGDLKKKLSNLDLEIPRKAPVDLAFREITRSLPFAAALGLSAPWTRTREDMLRDLLKATDAEQRTKALNQIIAARIGAEPLRDKKGKLLYDELCRQLLHWAKDSKTLSEKDLRPSGPDGDCTALTLARFLEDRFLLPRPAELHYLVMLLKDLDPAKPSQPQDLHDLQLALKVRVLAEEAALAAAAYREAHAYSEAVLPWIQKQLVEADKERRLGEDWLFGATDSDWAKARGYLTAAKEKYEKAQEDAERLRAAFELRDVALADLPYYAQWLASQRLSRNPDVAARTHDLVKQVERLSANLGELTWILMREDFEAVLPRNAERNPDGLSVRKLLDERTRQVKEDFDDPVKGLRHRFTQECLRLKVVHQRQLLHDLEAVLATPLIEDVSLRTDLLKASRGISSKLLEGQIKLADADQEAPNLNEKIDRQKRLALTVATPTWRDNHPLATAEKDTAEVLGDKLREYWKKLPDQVSADLAASYGTADLREAADKLREASVVSRLLPGGDVPAWDTVPFAAPEGLRRLRLHELCLWQAQRALDDHWYTENREPYYVPSVRAYVQMAEDLVEIGDANELVNSARKKNARRFQPAAQALALKATSDPNWTSELKFPLSWKLTAAAGVPQGVPMHWLQLDGPFAKVQDPLFRERAAIQNWSPKDEKTLSYLLKKPGTEEAQGTPTSTLYCLYRGQEIRSDNSLRFWKPETIVHHFPPEKSGLAFRLDKNFDYGAISFVLDCSGSMLQPYGDRKRIDYAIEALETILSTIPDNTHVSLLGFLWDKKTQSTKMVTIHEVAQWRRGAQLQGVKDKLAELKKKKDEFGSSPIAHALIHSRDNGFPGPAKNYQGPKLIVALTDGDDNDSHNYEKQLPTVGVNEKDPGRKKRYNDAVRSLMEKEFARKEYEIHLVCFNDDLKSGEAKSAEEQFGIVAQADFDNPGSFVHEPDGAKLAAALDRAIRPRLGIQQGVKVLSGRAGEEIQPNAFASALDWYLVPAADLTVKLRKISAKSQDVKLAPGDFMILTLKRLGSELFFERSLLTQEERDKVVVEETKGPWTTAVMRNQITGKGDLVRHLVTVEESPTGKGERLLQQKVLGFVWMELKPKDSRPLHRLTWQRDYNFAAPAVSAQSLGWPFQDGRPVGADLKIWWTTNRYPENVAHSVGLARDMDKSLREAFPKQINVGGAAVHIEDVVVEDHEVAIAPGKTASKSCLVVRIRHDAKKPAFVQLQMTPDSGWGEEHRFYEAVNKYAAFFWNVPNPEQARFTLHLTSLEDFKRTNEGAAFSLPAPSTSRTGPDPVPLAQ